MSAGALRAEQPGAGATAAPAPRGRFDRPALIALAVLALAAAVLIVVEGRHMTFFFDEWDFLLGRRGHSADDFLRSQNGNPSLFPVVLFKALLQVFGTDGHWAFRAALLVLHLIVVALVLVVARRRVGLAGGAVAAALVLVLGRASDDLIWAFQTGFLLSVLGGLVALAALDAGRRDPRRDLLACAGLVLSLGSSSTGIPFLVVVLVELWLAPDRRRRAWVALVPLGLYVLWSIGYGDSQFRWANVPLTPGFAADLAASTVGGVVGLTVDWGRTLALAALAALGVWWLRGGRGTPRLWGLLAALVALWGLTGLARASIATADAPRYVYAGAVLVVLAAAELLRGRRLADGRGAAVAALLVAWAAFAGWGALHAKALQLRGFSDDARARLAALDLKGAGVPDQYRPVPAQPQVIAGPVVQVQRDFGRIAWTPAQLRRAPLVDRQAADQTLLALSELSVRAAPAACAGAVAPALTLAPGASVTVAAGAPTAVRASRFGPPESGAPLTTLPAGSTTITADRDASPLGWRLTFAAPVRACR
jgi:hypothetical protein